MFVCGFEGISSYLHEWLSGGVSPCQGEGRGFESRLVLQNRNHPVFLLTWEVSSHIDLALSPNGKALDSDSSISRFESW